MFRFGVVLALAFSISSASVRADTLHNVATALDFAGFDARGSQNPLSGGVDLLITRRFNGNFFDFGAAELTLQGPISLQLSTGGRILPQFDVAFTTAVNAQNPATLLNYSYESDIGPQSTSIEGSTLIDGTFSINALGFYDFTLTSSTRSTATREGIVTSTSTSDSDIGPITVSGNIFVDALAVLVDPLAEQTGGENPFTAISKMLIDPSVEEQADFQSLTDLKLVALMDGSRHFDLLQPAYPQPNQSGFVVPEPPVLVLLLLGLPVVLHRTWRIR